MKGFGDESGGKVGDGETGGVVGGRTGGGVIGGGVVGGGGCGREEWGESSKKLAKRASHATLVLVFVLVEQVDEWNGSPM